jgi:hypothetical protein
LLTLSAVAKNSRVRSVPLIAEEEAEEEGNERSFIPDDVSGVRCMKLISLSVSLSVLTSSSVREEIDRIKNPHHHL